MKRAELQKLAAEAFTHLVDAASVESTPPVAQSDSSPSTEIVNQQMAQSNIEDGIRMAKAMCKKLQVALSKIKGGFSGPKHKRNEEKAAKLAIDVQCGDKGIQVKYSKRWQKMKRRIMREFQLKWKRWALFIRDEETSNWVKLQPPYGPLTPSSS
jgi:hypothetical protein